PRHWSSDVCSSELRGRQAAVTVRQLHLIGSPVLRQRSTPVAAVDYTVRRLVDDLFETMHAAKGVGLAANQIGAARRVAVVDVGEDAPPPLVLINPRIGQASELQETAEERSEERRRGKGCGGG